MYSFHVILVILGPEAQEFGSYSHQDSDDLGGRPYCRMLRLQPKRKKQGKINSVKPSSFVVSKQP